MVIDSTKLVHVWNPRPKELAILPVLIIVMLFGIWQSLTSNPFLPLGCHGSPTIAGIPSFRGCYSAGAIAFVGFFLAAWDISDILRARKLEFYEDHAKLFGKGGSADQDFRYDQLTMGSLRSPIFTRSLLDFRFSKYFDLKAFSPSTGSQIFPVKNEWVKGANQTLYDWLSARRLREYQKSSNPEN
jgi:hypothetical protein